MENNGKKELLKRLAWYAVAAALAGVAIRTLLYISDWINPPYVTVQVYGPDGEHEGDVQKENPNNLCYRVKNIMHKSR